MLLTLAAAMVALAQDAPAVTLFPRIAIPLCSSFEGGPKIVIDFRPGAMTGNLTLYYKGKPLRANDTKSPELRLLLDRQDEFLRRAIGESLKERY